MSNRPAFTLIEILVVVAIIAMLAVIAIANYGAVRKSAKMDYTADALVDLINLQRSNAKSGRVAAVDGGASLCYGVRFSRQEPFVETVTAPYVSVDTSVRLDKADFCNMEKAVYEPFTQFEDNIVSKLEKFGLDSDGITIMFRPPEARMSFGEENPVYTNDPKITVTFGSSDGKESRSFTVDAASGLAERVGTVAPSRTRTPSVRPSLNPSVRQPVLRPSILNNTLRNSVNP